MHSFSLIHRWKDLHLFVRYAGISLRDPLRAGASDDQLRDLIAGVWGKRVDRYSEERTELAALQNTPKKIEMYQIGG